MVDVLDCDRGDRTAFGGNKALDESPHGTAVQLGMGRHTATRAELLEAAARTSGLPPSQAREILEMMLEEVGEALARGESVKLRSFGQFSVRAKRERVGRNPRTGIEVPITSRRVLTFRPSPCLLDRVAVGAMWPASDD